MLIFHIFRIKLTGNFSHLKIAEDCLKQIASDIDGEEVQQESGCEDLSEEEEEKDKSTDKKEEEATGATQELNELDLDNQNSARSSSSDKLVRPESYFKLSHVYRLITDLKGKCVTRPVLYQAQLFREASHQCHTKKLTQIHDGALNLRNPHAFSLWQDERAPCILKERQLLI